MFWIGRGSGQARTRPTGALTRPTGALTRPTGALTRRTGARSSVNVSDDWHWRLCATIRARRHHALGISVSRSFPSSICSHRVPIARTKNRSCDTMTQVAACAKISASSRSWPGNVHMIRRFVHQIKIRLGQTQRQQPEPRLLPRRQHGDRPALRVDVEAGAGEQAHATLVAEAKLSGHETKRRCRRR